MNCPFRFSIMESIRSFWQLADELQGQSKVSEDQEWFVAASRLAEQNLIVNSLGNIPEVNTTMATSSRSVTTATATTLSRREPQMQAIHLIKGPRHCLPLRCFPETRSLLDTSLFATMTQCRRI